ncbi:MAG TPA: hypothetical protein VGA67_04060 [Candidatus Dojkabacteria bacterium]
MTSDYSLLVPKNEQSESSGSGVKTSFTTFMISSLRFGISNLEFIYGRVTEWPKVPHC